MTPEQRKAFEAWWDDYCANHVMHIASHRDFVLAAWQAGAAAQREADAKICREQIEEWEGEDPRAAAKDCADAIESQEQK